MLIKKVAKEGFGEIIKIARDNDIICDGWMALIPFLPRCALSRLTREAGDSGVRLTFVATTRDIESTVMSELSWWTTEDLERKSGLTPTQRESLEQRLRERATEHRSRVQELHNEGNIGILPLESLQGSWPTTLASISGFTDQQWLEALQHVGVCNASPCLPLEGVLLTLHIGSGKAAEDKIASIARLLDQIEQDSLCRYILVLGIDADEADSDAASKLIQRLNDRVGRQLKSFHHIKNPPRSSHEPFAICSVWDELATVAWTNGADWVVLLGDDIELECPYHYRAIYRAFLDIAQQLKVSFGFGCPWWNDRYVDCIGLLKRRSFSIKGS